MPLCAKYVCILDLLALGCSDPYVSLAGSFHGGPGALEPPPGATRSGHRLQAMGCSQFTPKREGIGLHTDVGPSDIREVRLV